MKELAPFTGAPTPELHRAVLALRLVDGPICDDLASAWRALVSYRRDVRAKIVCAAKRVEPHRGKVSYLAVLARQAARRARGRADPRAQPTEGLGSAMQTTYTNGLSVALPGMLADSGLFASDVTSYPAGEDIPPGRAVEVDVDGKLVLPKSATLGAVKGVSIYTSAKAGTATYTAGEMVPVLRRGRIWAEFTGTGATDGEACNIKHASTDGDSQEQHRGKFTDAAVDTDAGQETSAFARAVFRDGDGATLALVDINLP